MLRLYYCITVRFLMYLRIDPESCLAFGTTFMPRSSKHIRSMSSASSTTPFSNELSASNGRHSLLAFKACCCKAVRDDASSSVVLPSQSLLELSSFFKCLLKVVLREVSVRCFYF
jgi:hypothetical protein